MTKKEKTDLDVNVEISNDTIGNDTSTEDKVPIGKNGMPIPFSQRHRNIITIFYNDELIDIDLHKLLPFKLFKQNYKGQYYIPSQLVREVLRTKGHLRQYCDTILKDISDTHTMITANVIIDGTPGTASDVISKKTLQSSAVGQTARVVMLATKDALRYFYKCFEGEYEIVDEDDVSAVTDDIIESAGDVTLFNEIKTLIESAKTIQDLVPAVSRIKNESSKLSTMQIDSLRNIYTRMNNILSTNK